MLSGQLDGQVDRHTHKRYQGRINSTCSKNSLYLNFKFFSHLLYFHGENMYSIYGFYLSNITYVNVCHFNTLFLNVEIGYAQIRKYLLFKLSQILSFTELFCTFTL